MTKELIENIRAIIVPYMAHDLRRINYENMGEIDAEQFSEDMNEILDLATKALEQEPCEDAISRQMVLEYIERSEAELGHSSENELVCRDIKEFPPVTLQEPKTGHWIYIGQSEINGLKICKCSECGERAYGSLDYCGNCGAKMVEPQESEG